MDYGFRSVLLFIVFRLPASITVVLSRNSSLGDGLTFSSPSRTDIRRDLELLRQKWRFVENILRPIVLCASHVPFRTFSLVSEIAQLLFIQHIINFA